MTAAIQTISLEGLTRADWLKLRRRGIGGSDVAAIIGISKWRTPLDIYNDKTEEDTAKEILGWVFEAAISFFSIFVITAALLAFFGILDIHII